MRPGSHAAPACLADTRLLSSALPVPPYVPLWIKTNFSFLEGASHPEELVGQAEALGLPALAVTDRDGVQGIVRAHVAAKERGLRLIVGSEVRVSDGSTVVLLCVDRNGYANLCRLVTSGRLRSPKGSCLVEPAELAAHGEGLLALWRGEPAEPGPLREAFGDRLYALIARHRRDDEPAAEARLRATARRLAIQTVAAVEVLYHTRARRPLQDVLTCIRHGVRLSEAGTLPKPNAEHVLLAPRLFEELFDDDPGAVARTREVAERCAFGMGELRYVYPAERLPDGKSSQDWLRELSHAGARARYGEHVPRAVTQQLERELAIIEQLEYPGYFLTMHEIVGFCRAQGILCQGRGSAANSAVCYCLGITAVDPVKMDLLFERFLSLERHEPPDIDLDIEHERREEVIQHVYAKYGRDRAAMVCNVIRYRSKSAIREVGKVLGMPETALDRLTKLGARGDGDLNALLREAGLDPAAPAHAWFLGLVDEIRDFPRHLSIHPGGFLLGHEPVHDLVPIENASMEGRTVIQWDKDDVEALGLFKVDLLALGSLTLCHESFRLLARHKRLALDLARIPPEDPATYDMICRGDTVGVFQIESRAQMAMLPRLRPRTFYDLVVEVSIVRPGPISGDMVHPYLRRRHGQEPVAYPHKCLVPVLEKTLGVPLFQEQVMKLAMVAADYTPGEADQLRRDMAAWRKHGRMERHRERLIARMLQKGIEREFAERVFEQIRGFGEYGFPESHAASFALIAYATAWLRRHHLDVFTCALLNAQPMGFYSAATIVEDAKRHGLEIRPVDVVLSGSDCTLEDASPGEELQPLRMGLRWIKGLGGADLDAILEARRERPFADLGDFVRRTRLEVRKLEALAAAGALVGLAASRRDALWELWAAAREPREPLPLVPGGEEPVFAPLDPFETVAWDYRATGHSTQAHPLESLRASLAGQGMRCAEELRTVRHGSPARCAGLVICRQRPGTAKGVVFLTLEDETGFCNVVIWPDVFDRFAALVKTEPLLGIEGKVQMQDGVVHLVAKSIFVPRVEAAPPTAGSRDFH
ncbi:MAG: error-prone DNA polymerase [Planctomycetes bacterium]|nr:error-prone DNA polymerase [Planctomycetota bacterium]